MLRQAVTPEDAEAATAAFAARDGTRPRDAALSFSPATAATIEPWVDGAQFFPPIFADVEAARQPNMRMCTLERAGDVGRRMASLLERRLAEGVEVRVLVDALGSQPYWSARAMFRRLAAAGAQIVVNDVLPPVRRGLFPDGLRIDRRQSGIGHADHRKLYVLDGTVAWIGGAGIEDHFDDGRFHDMMVRVTGDVVRQAQAAFLTSFRANGGPLGDGLARLFPEPADPGATPVALTQVIPPGHVAAAEAVAEQLEGATRRLDVINPYVTDRGMVNRILAAARRGVAVRIVVAEKSNNAQAAAALRHDYPRLLAAGVEVFEVPGTVVHAKVVVADDVVSFGTVNLDAWSLQRDFEIMMTAVSAPAAALVRERLFEPDIARSRRATPAVTRWAVATGRVCDRLRPLL